MGKKSREKFNKSEKNEKDSMKYTKCKNKILNKDNFQIMIAVISLFVSFTSFIVSFSLQTKMNNYTENMGNLNFDLTISQTPETITYDDMPYTISPFEIKKNKATFSGDYGKCFFATVYNKNIDLIEIENTKTNDEKSDIFKIFKNGSFINPYKKKDRQYDDGILSFYFSPGYNNDWSVMHIILKGYNGYKSYYTLICSVEKDENKIESELFSNEDLYDRNKIVSFLEKTSSINLSEDELIEQIEDERNLLKEKLTE